jgi:hypothetical protein
MNTLNEDGERNKEDYGKETKKMLYSWVECALFEMRYLAEKRAKRGTENRKMGLNLLHCSNVNPPKIALRIR